MQVSMGVRIYSVLVIWTQQCIRTVYTHNSRFTVKFPVLDESARDFTLDAYATTTSITDLTPDLDYSVSINSYYGSEESIPIFGQLTSKYIFSQWVHLDCLEKMQNLKFSIEKDTSTSITVMLQ